MKTKVEIAGYEIEIEEKDGLIMVKAEKDEEIVDQDLENLIPQYLTAVKDRNNFLYDEVCKYFSENNIPFDVQTDYAVFYNALNSIIEKKGHQSKYTEKCKQRMVRECRKKFLDRNKNKEKRKDISKY